ncbi:hypothetical protein HDU76_004469 [Blyttiomyces sp. JEL0837]|nr:hypothetical protein HDU76_004469 [Blyttiomyces sp. JEL0837]
MAPKKKALGDLLAELSNPAPDDFDPDDQTFATGKSGGYGDDDDDQVMEQDEETAREHYVKVGKGKIRSQLGILLDDPRYVGKRVSRKSLEADQEVDEEGMDDDNISDDNDDNEEMDAENDNDSDNEEQDLEDQESDEDQDDDDDDDEDSDENADEDQEQDLEQQSRIESQLKKLSEDEKTMVARLSQAAQGDVEKGFHVQNQTTIWESLLDIRIQIQPALSIANRLPDPSNYPKFVTPSPLLNSDECSATTSKVHQASAELLGTIDDLLTFRATLTVKNESIVLAPADAATNLLSKKRKRHQYDFDDMDSILQDVGADVDFLDAAFEPFRDATIEKWNAKVIAAAGGVGIMQQQKKFKAINQSVLTQVKSILGDMDRLVKRTQLVREGGSDARRLGSKSYAELKPVPEESQAPLEGHDPEELDRMQQKRRQAMDSHLSTYDEEVFDDGDFYQQLLKELIESRMDNDDPLLMSIKWAELKQMQNRQKKKRQVDTKASKGRKLRYHVHEKIQNFMAPQPRGTWHDSMIDELFNSLFGTQTGGQEDSGAKSNEPEQNEVALPTDGLTVFG